MLVKFLVCVLAGLGAGNGTGLAGLSAAAVISPMLVTFLGFPSYPTPTAGTKTWISKTAP